MKDLTQLHTSPGTKTIRRQPPRAGETTGVVQTETALPSDDISLSAAKSKSPVTGQLQASGIESAAQSAMGMLPGVSKAGCPHCK